MTTHFPKVYDHSFEQNLYEYRLEKGCFSPDPNASKDVPAFTIPMPPPNVTGILHTGHALMLAVEDTMARYHRLLGASTLRIPGTDHAGIATQLVVENELIKKKKKTRFDLGRETFLGKIREWVASSRHTIVSQTKRMGASCDWSKEQFTMSERLSRSVRKAFTNLHAEGKVYQSVSMVNRSPAAQTVVSDLEVENREIQGKMYYLRYFVEGKGDSITIATTRPETIFADVALAVHPKDRRYKKRIGKNVLIPLVNKPIPVIADESIDFDFGTGAMKVTPAHDEVDFEMAKRHNLSLNHFAVDKEAKFTKFAGEHFAGKDIEEFFPNLIQMLNEIGNIEKIEEHTHTVPYCERTGCKIQSMLSQQRFMNVLPAAVAAREALEKEEIKVHPERFIKTFDNRLTDIKPRCISRQLRWGHRIPVRYDAAGETHIYDEDTAIDIQSGTYRILSMIIFNITADSRLPNPFNIEELIEILTQPSLTPADKTVARAYINAYRLKFQADKKLLKEIEELAEIIGSIDGDHKAIVQAGAKLLDILEKSCNIRQSGDKYEFYFSENGKELQIVRQESDVLDARFSSALRPFSSLGRPEETPDMEQFYPMSVLETGHDLMFSRVLRMLFMGHEQTGKRPFKNIYLHGLVRDEYGQKIAKSKGNASDTVQLIDKYGADALRAALVQGSTPGTDMKLSEKKLEYMHRFFNKLWNASRFVSTRFVADGEPMPEVSYEMLERDITQHITKLNSYDVRMLGKLQSAVDQVGKYYSKFMLGEALQESIEMVRHDFCDRYIEITKLQQSDYTPKVMLYTLLTSFKLLHPVIPHVTEKLWTLLGGEGILMSSSRPAPKFEIEKNYKMNLLMDMISQRRTLRQKATEKPHEKVILLVQANKQIQELVEEHSTLIQHIVHGQEIMYKDEFADVDDGFHTALIMDIKIGVKGLKSVDKKQKLEDIERQVVEEEQSLQRIRGMLVNDDFLRKSSPQIIEEKKMKMQELKQKITQLQLEIQKIKMIKK